MWFPARDLYLSGDDTIVSPIALGPGADLHRAVVREHADARRSCAAGPGARRRSAVGRRLATPSSPHPLRPGPGPGPAVTAGAPTTYDKVQSLIAWIGAHTRYSTDIPPLPPGQDTVDEFLFGNRTGFCEQISTSLAVMLRSLGIPAREAVGYVPGPYNPITDLYDVEAKDAHAWVQVWFPGYGWQSFDPTAVVPLANPSPGSTLAARGHRGAGPPSLDPHRARPGDDGGWSCWRSSRRRRRPAHVGRAGHPGHRGPAGAPAGGAGRTRP